MQNIFKRIIRNLNSKVIAAPILISYLTLGNSSKNYFKSFNTKVLKAESNTTTLEDNRKLFIPGTDELSEGELREVKFGNTTKESLVVINYKNNIYALSNYCPHFGAPMHQGLLVDNLLKCPWHGASFDITNGRTEISPSIDDLVSYKVNKDSDGQYYVDLPKENKDVKFKQVAEMVKRDKDNKTKFLVIGGGPAALSAAETLRQNGFTGEIKLLSKDSNLPYDRTLISKFIPGSVDKVWLRNPQFYKDHDINVELNSEVVDIDPSNKKVKLRSGSQETYDKLLLATGGDPLIPKIKGKDAKHVFTLRTYSDIEEISKHAKEAKNLVVVGSSFIGMEAASCLKKTYKNLNVTIVDPNIAPMAHTLGIEIGAALQK